MNEMPRTVEAGALHFGPLGLGGAMPPETWMAMSKDTMAELTLPEEVPDVVHRPWDKLRSLYCDGLFAYDNFTRAEREAYRVLEVRLKVRFLSHYDNEIP